MRFRAAKERFMPAKKSKPTADSAKPVLVEISDGIAW